MAETPLFLSIMIMVYRDKQDVDILVSKDEKAQRKHLFNTYIECMFDRPRSKNISFTKQDVLRWLSWLAGKMAEHNKVPYALEDMQPTWLNQKSKLAFNIIYGFTFGLIIVLVFGLGLSATESKWSIDGLSKWLISVLMAGTIGSILRVLTSHTLFGRDILDEKIVLVDTLTWNWMQGIMKLRSLWVVVLNISIGMGFGLQFGLSSAIIAILISDLFFVLFFALIGEPISQTTYPGQRISFSLRNSHFAFILFGLIFGLIFGFINGFFYGLLWGLTFGFISGFLLGYNAVIQHYTLRLTLTHYNLLPWRLVPFLDHCVDLIFLRRVGGGYIFIHRLLMEHFAEMYEISQP
jgi:hypothetical protein